MRWIVATAVALLLMGGSAEARHRHRHHHDYSPAELSDEAAFLSPAGPRYEPRSNKTPSVNVGSMVPSNWKEEPANERWDGKRYLSPDGTSWIAIYRARFDGGRPSDHFKDVVFAPDETISYLRGARTWVVVSGLRATFYRKAVLACAGSEWHHIAFEYPIELHERLDRLVISAADALNNTEVDCSQPVARQ